MAEGHDPERSRWLDRLLEMVPGLISWAIIIGPIWLSFSYPWLVAYFVLSFDFYWVCRAIWFAGAVIVAFGRIREVLAADWPGGAGRPRRPRRPTPPAPGAARGGVRRREQPPSESSPPRLERRGAMERRAMRRELAELDRARARRPRRACRRSITSTSPSSRPTPSRSRSCGITVRALADADWPSDRKIVAIITRETDEGGIANVKALQAEFGDRFRELVHILDPLEPGIVVGKSSAMAWGGRWLYRLLVRERGMDPRLILVTDLDADYRVHPQYFNYLTWVHLTDPNRETQLYQPIPYFHNNIWEAPLLLRLFAAILTQLQMWRSVLPEKLQSFGSYSTTLHMVHEVGYWATDAIPEDSRFYWKSYFRTAIDSAPFRSSSRSTATPCGRRRTGARSRPSTCRRGAGHGASPTSRTSCRTRSVTPRSASGRAPGGSSTCSASTSTGRSRRS